MSSVVYAAPAAAGPLCERAVSIAPEAGTCAETGRGIAFAANPERASALLAYLNMAEKSFARYFERDVPTYAIVESDEPGSTSAILAKLQRNGFPATLPWISRGGLRTASEANIRQAIESSGKANGLSAAQVEAIISTALETQRANLDDESLDRTEALTLPHELGHIWYIKAYWPERDTGAKHYGGPAWDWMDETAAILMEDDSDPGNRRRTFRMVYSGVNSDPLAGVSASELLDLNKFVLREHPGLDQAVATAGQGAEGMPKGPVIQLSIRGSGNALPGALKNAQALMIYYAQARLLADFLLERSNHPGIFDSITDGMRMGLSFDGWLGAKGGSFNLPRTLPEAQAEWQAWLLSRFGPPRQVTTPASARNEPPTVDRCEAQPRDTKFDGSSDNESRRHGCHLDRS